jgi:cobalt-precorrin 5A hydrolase
MKLAIIAVTHKGALVAKRLQQAFAASRETDVYLKMGRTSGCAGITYQALGQLVKEIFPRYDGLVFIMATGIVVRVLAPCILDKRTDPAVVVLDDEAKHAISLLSGHIGGANELTLKIAAAVTARPVITTATDVAGRPAADLLAVKLQLAIESFPVLKRINAAIANGDEVGFYIDGSLPNRKHYIEAAAVLGVTLVEADEVHNLPGEHSVLISDKVAVPADDYLWLRPPTLAIGIGCRRDTGREELLFAVESACRRIGRSSKSVAVIGSTIVKKDEPGLLEMVQSLSVPAKFYDNEELNRCIEENRLVVSDFVYQQIGVGNVCEAAAMLAGQTKSLLLPKNKYPKVTIAIAEVR